MVTMQHQSTFNAPMLPRGERLANSCPTRAAILRGVRCRDFPHSPSSFCRFGVEYRKECSPGRVANTFGEMMIPDHPANVQIFDRDVVKFLDELKACFVEKVETPPFDIQMLLRLKSRSFTSVVTASFLPTDGALRGLQPSRRAPQVLRVRNLLARRVRREVLNANVNADARACLGNVPALIAFNAETDVPTINLMLDGDGFNCAFDGAREPDAATADFRERQLVAFQLPARLQKGERIIAILISESRIARFLSCFDPAEKAVESLLYSLQSILQDLTMNESHVQAFGFDVGQLVSLIEVVERDARHLVGVSSLLNGGVVQLTAQCKRGSQLLVNRPRDTQLILERLSHGPQYSAHRDEAA